VVYWYIRFYRGKDVTKWCLAGSSQIESCAHFSLIETKLLRWSVRVNLWITPTAQGFPSRDHRQRPKAAALPSPALDFTPLVIFLPLRKTRRHIVVAVCWEQASYGWNLHVNLTKTIHSDWSLLTSRETLLLLRSCYLAVKTPYYCRLCLLTPKQQDIISPAQRAILDHMLVFHNQRRDMWWQRASVPLVIWLRDSLRCP